MMDISRLPIQRQNVPFRNFEIYIDFIPDQDALLDLLLQKPADDPAVLDEQIPYWGHLWPSAIALAHWLDAHPEEVQGKEVLELGCGVGLPGIVAGKIGGHVTLSDYLPEALKFAGRNWEMNLGTPARLAHLDWRNPDPALQSDVILAADVAYEKRLYAPLLETFRTLLKPGGKAILTEPNRAMTQDFLAEIANLGFYVKKELNTLIINELKTKINILIINI